MGATVKSKEREVRREELRVYLAENNKVRQIIDNIEKLENPTIEMDALQIQRVRAAMDARISLLKKYLPDVKQQEIEANVTTMSHEQWIDNLK